jgi:hypothetical protein
MNVREFLPKDIKSVVRVLVILILLKLVINATLARLPGSVQGYVPDLG